MKAPNYMQFVCGLSRAEKAVRKQNSPELMDRFKTLRDAAMAAYKAKEYITARQQYLVATSLGHD